MEKLKQKKGFTLIEVLIVIGIITILSSAVIVSTNPAEHFARARNATRLSHMNSIATAIYSYAVDNDGNLPDCDSTVHESVPSGTTPLSSGSSSEDFDNKRGIEGCRLELVDGENKLESVYMPELPVDPKDGEYYRIASDLNGNRIEITSTAAEASNLRVVQ
ncbi:MAG: type II secretion system protein [Candidatus Pacebacteria bacterium]|jgi:prepilin-type N-terminal cleavage/methylation domain-containing protein|nr:type II secretion system protein [Candidatus Paceibacterota bacterium]MDD5752932.1 type II secretion system protein [Candidatus Paceibacterota bacterium]